MMNHGKNVNHTSHHDHAMNQDDPSKSSDRHAVIMP